ncbi:hypothetical protein [Agromyces sp. H66]|uniref:hypothetical protein n=1 Tax=Agromyces sp. H66 TaxID=2529859 RepID=UPI0010AA81D8|nr:hypothetical protein [Agromyces sp. H66]
MDVTERRIRELQRLAYGADATEAQRARAIDELAVHAVPAVGAEAVGGEAVVGERIAHARGAGRVSTDPADVAHDRPHGGRAWDDDAPRPGRLGRWTIAAAGIGLVLGAALGWAVGRQTPADFLPLGDDPSSADLGVPLEDTGLIELFDRLPPAAESSQVARVDDTIDPASVRRLVTPSDAPDAYLARTVGGEDVCLVLLPPAEPSPLACSVDGRLPADGLGVRYESEEYGNAVARLKHSGAVELSLVVVF